MLFQKSWLNTYQRFPIRSSHDDCYLATLGSYERSSIISSNFTNLFFQRFILESYTAASKFIFQGLFVQCLQWMPGQFQCDNFLRPIFSMSALAIFEQAFAILSTIMMGVALILLLCGMVLGSYSDFYHFYTFALLYLIRKNVLTQIKSVLKCSSGNLKEKSVLLNGPRSW